MSEMEPNVTPNTVDSGAPVVEPVKVETPSVEPSAGPVVDETTVTREDWLKSSPTLRKAARNNPEKEVTEEPEPTLEAKDVVEPPVETPVVPEVSKIKLSTGDELTEEEILELKKGNMLNADYTRKTQELAEERRKIQQESGKYQDKPVEDALALWDQLSLDPVGTLEYLKEHYKQQGITEPEDPEVVKVRIEANKAKEEAANVAKELDAIKLGEGKKVFDDYMDTLTAKYKDYGFDKEQVLTYCRTNAIVNPEVGFKAMMFDPTIEGLQGKVKEVSTKAEEAKKTAIADYIKEKVVTSANFDTPVGSGISGTGISVEKPKGMKGARQAAMARIRANE